MLNSSYLDLRQNLREQLESCAYPGYVYGYPHKKAYRPLARPRSLAEVWHPEERRQLYCYVHLPFCNQRCSFCNLFTYVPGDRSLPQVYVEALPREMSAYAEALDSFGIARLYLGGGTPTYLTSSELRFLVGQLRAILHVDPARTMGCIEVSPETIDAEKVDTLRELGFQRVSLGIQSFDEEELRAVNRRFDFARHAEAISLLDRAGFPQINLDLIYGLPGQTLQSWEDSLNRAIDAPVTSLFLYPLYVRPMTGLAMRDLHVPTTHQMMEAYDRAVHRLKQVGFRQITTRQFRRDSNDASDEEYRCTQDGMLGLGAGARSYTRTLHYSTPWKMIARNVRTVIDDYVQRVEQGNLQITYGIELDDDERSRRWIIQSLLYWGADAGEFHRLFHADLLDRFAPEWHALFEEGCVEQTSDRLVLTPRGVRHADVVGQLFFSDRVRELMASYEYDE